MKKLTELRAKLKSGEDRANVESQLRQALSEYFLADMRLRVRELDEIKAKLAETESKLQKRLDSQQESIDLQLKLFLQEADGFGFFRSEDSLERTAVGSMEGLQDSGFAPGLGLSPMSGYESAPGSSGSVLTPRR